MIDVKHPKNIDKYEIVSVLGQGAMGMVYKGYDNELDRFVAIKVLHSYLMDGEMCVELERRFNHEVKAAARCLHQNIVTIFDCGMCSGKPYMVMEYVKGIDLRIMLKSQHLFSINHAIGIVIKILDALYAAHELGIVHRDIKPANILLLDKGIIKVADFGVARIDNSDLTQLGDVIGTPCYMSPEAKKGALVDNRSDLYSTALVLLEILTNKRFISSDDCTDSIVKHIQELPLNSLQKKELGQILIKALENKPENRFQTAVEFSQALLNCHASSDSSYQQAYELAETVTRIRTSFPEGFSADYEHSQVSCLSSLSKEELGLIEKNLTKYLGPIAKVMLKKQASDSENVEQLLDSLVSNISTNYERKEFISNLQSIDIFKTYHSVLSTPVGKNKDLANNPQEKVILKESELSQLVAYLTVYLGPVAKHIVKNSLENSSSVEQLHLLLADKIPDERQRVVFLKKCKFKG